MKKNKQEKGITLIALIITIVVLLILASVAISSIQNDGLLSYAENAANKFNQSQSDEKDVLGSYLNYLKENIDDSETIGDATVGEKVTSISTINGKKYTETNPVIPIGFMAIDTETSSWDVEDLTEEVKKGLVISDGTSEFVWIPVENIGSFARLQNSSTQNYEGVLYNFEIVDDGTLTVTEKTEYGVETQDCREPANLDLTNYDNTTNLSIWTENLYQDSFNSMVQSVSKYKGFYVGRYQMSSNRTSKNIESTEDGAQVNSSSNMWFGLYQKALTYSTSNSKLGVVSEMIWGCQWDAMISLILTGPDASNITSTINNTFSNICDLSLDDREWTQEVNNTKYRVARSRGNRYNHSATTTDYAVPPVPHISIYSRFTLYVEV